jgi:acetylornithine deacetylase
MTNTMLPISEGRILRSVDALFDKQLEFLADLIRIPSQRGKESEAQRFMAEAYEACGYSVDIWRIDVDDIRDLPGFSPVSISYDDAFNVVATHMPMGSGGRSLILNGHIDVVPTGPADRWTHDPYDPVVEHGWMYGRGSGDMKAGLSACLFALKALRALGYQPAAKVLLQSVVEEECTGNGALACLQRGYLADAVLIPEPLEPKIMRAQVGPIWFNVEVEGDPQHASGAFDAGANAIEKAYLIIQALKRLEIVWNVRKTESPHFCDHPHPIRFNLGKIEGGDWTSSVPARCSFDMRVAVYPDQKLADAKEEIERCVADAARGDPFLSNHMPKVTYNGFMAEGYVLANSEDVEDALRRSHVSVWQEPLLEHVTSAATDARFFGLYANIPAVVYGPHCRMPHGYDEAVDLESLRKVTQTLAVFVADWCGLEPVEPNGKASL